ncbi:MAG: hypothetical protein IH947_15960 [Bacteroidetes bacterium]|nr:hypothetical protein [Bacteroidota bacterium]
MPFQRNPTDLQPGLSVVRAKWQAGVATSNLASITSPVDTMQITPNDIG